MYCDVLQHKLRMTPHAADAAAHAFSSIDRLVSSGQQIVQLSVPVAVGSQFHGERIVPDRERWNVGRGRAVQPVNILAHPPTEHLSSSDPELLRIARAHLPVLGNRTRTRWLWEVLT